MQSWVLVTVAVAVSGPCKLCPLAITGPKLGTRGVRCPQLSPTTRVTCLSRPLRPRPASYYRRHNVCGAAIACVKLPAGGIESSDVQIVFLKVESNAGEGHDRLAVSVSPDRCDMRISVS